MFGDLGGSPCVAGAIFRVLGRAPNAVFFVQNECPKPKSKLSERTLADEFMTNARVGRTRIGVGVSCDVRYGMMLHTICDDLMDFRHDTNQLESHSPTLLLEPQYACCSEPHGLRQHLQEPGLGAVDTNITRTRDKTDCYSYKSIQILQTPTAFCTQESVRKESLGTILQLFVMLRLQLADSGPFQDHSYPFSSSCQPLLFSWWILAQRPLEKKWNKRGWKITAQKHCFWLVFSLQERMWQDLLRREVLTWIHSKQSLDSRRQDLNLAKVRECCRSA